MDFKYCPKCNGELEAGYLLGKHNRIRWSASSQGMTIFHGVPLIRLEPDFWKQRKWWAYAPNIPAQRCPRCRWVSFDYNNDAAENPNPERRASLIIAVVLALMAAVLVWFTFQMQRLAIASSMSITVLLLTTAVIVLLIAGLFFRHVFANR